MPTLVGNGVRFGSSTCPDARGAVADLARQVRQPEVEFVLYFASARYDPAALARAAHEAFDGRAVGCTTAGEIGPQGYTQGGIVAVSLGTGPIRVHRFALDGVSALDLAAVETCRRTFDARRRYPLHGLGLDCFAMLLIDGLCLREEHVVAAVHHQFQPMPIVGGSAGDDAAYRRTHVFVDGRAISGGAALLVFELGGVPFRTFRLQDFTPQSEYLVITEAEPESRVVSEIDGFPATQVYARCLGVPPDELTPAHFASHSLMVGIGGEEYIRSVRTVRGDGSLMLHAAIDRGAVVRICRTDDTLAGLTRLLGGIRPGTRAADLLVAFDCMHRRMQLRAQHTVAAAEELLSRVPTIGFTTYGEVVDSLHVNQTMTGVLLGPGVLTEGPV